MKEKGRTRKKSKECCVVGITGEERQARVAKMTNKNVLQGSEMTKELKKDLKTHGQYGEDCFLVHETK